MSKGKPYTPKAEARPAEPKPAEPALATCSGCKFWRPRDRAGNVTRPPRGLCTKQPAAVSLGVIDGEGPVMTYGLTDADLPACGEALPK